MQSKATLSKLFGTNMSVRIDMDKLVLAGHSFGGSTMIETANQLSESDQPHAVLLLDPWYFPVHEQVESGKLRFKCPV